MTKIRDILDYDLFTKMVDEGYVRVQVHPVYPDLKIANYTERTQFERKWNAVTKMCRGLIFNSKSGDVLARPFQKIHNWDETDAPRITWEAPLFHWSNKEDGSLGIMYEAPDGAYAIATRGSFTSDQALHATTMAEAGDAWFNVDMMENGYTPLFEIVYPDNRIVLDYGDMDELILLGYIHIETGAFVPATPAENKRTFDDIRQDLSRENAEGWVVWLDPYKAVKIKQADYVELHRIVTGLNRKSIWRAMMENRYKELLDAIPDELYTWADEVFNDLLNQRRHIYNEATTWYERAGSDSGSQKDFALAVNDFVPAVYRGLVFALRSGKNINPSIYKMIEPKGAER